MKSILMLITVGLLFGGGLAIRCYVCSGNDCLYNNLKSSMIKDCSFPSNACAKIVTSGGSVSRSCLLNLIEGCTDVGPTNTCICTTDGCNGAGNVRGSVVLATVVGLVVMMMLV